MEPKGVRAAECRARDCNDLETERWRYRTVDAAASPMPVVLNDQIDLKALLISEIMNTVVDTAVGGKEHAHVAQDEILKEHPQRLHIAKQPLRGSPQQRRRK